MLAHLDKASDPSDVALEGELGYTPRGRLSTALLVLTGVLPLWRITSFIAKSLAGVKRPMTLRFSSAGLDVHERTELSGRVLRDTHRWIPRENLARIAREESYSGLALYTGMIALLLGTYFGTRQVLDGIGTFGGSPTLVGSGLLLLLLGAGVDFALWSARDSGRSSCRLVVVPRRGRAFCCRGVGRDQADAALRVLAGTE